MMFFDINRFHLIVLITWQFAVFYAAQMLFPIFSNYLPEWQCGDGPVGKDCDEYRRCGGNVTFVDTAFYSAALEFRWICDDSYWAAFCSQVQFFGVLVGTLSFGAISDLFGRRPVSLFVTSTGVLATLVSGMVGHMYLLFAVRFVIGLTMGGLIVVVTTYSMELLLPQQRIILRGFVNWGTARFMMTLICMFAKEWRFAVSLCAYVTAPAFFLIFFIFPESPTWLHSKGRLDEMRESEMKMASRAGMAYVPVKHRKVEKGKSLLQLLRGGLFKRLAVLWMMWFTTSTCAYATDLSSNRISGDFFVNQMLFGVLICISKLILVAVDTNIPGFSRRNLHQGAQLGAVICFGILTVLTLIGYKGVAFLVINLLGTVFVEYTWDACYLCAVESMETSSRASATGSSSLVARIGAIIAPTLTQLNHHWSASVYCIVVVLGTINLVQSYLFLVETKGVFLDNVTVDEDHNALPQSEEEAVEMENQEK